jgi:hypothetical protein
MPRDVLIKSLWSRHMICEAVNNDIGVLVKACTKCRESKPASEFSPDKRNKSGLQSWCKGCIRDYARQKYQDNPEKARNYKNSRYAADPLRHRQYTKNSTDKDRDGHNARRRKRRAQNPELYRRAKRDAYAKNPEKYRSERRAYRAENLDKERQHKREWDKANSDWVLAYNAKRRAEKINAKPPWLTYEQELQIKDLYETSRKISESTGVLHHVDHIHPLRGENFSGLHVPWNLRVVEMIENIRKNNSPPEEESHLFWEASIRFRVRQQLKKHTPSN